MFVPAVSCLPLTTEELKLKFSEGVENNHRILKLENEFLRVVILPDSGGKIISLRDLVNNREWLTQGPLPEPGAVSRVGDTWTGREGWGWDECFPNISAAPPTLADHGEIWSRPWQFEMTPDGLVGKIEGFHFDYTFERRFRLENRVLIASYRVVNRMATPLKAVWAMHSVFAAKPGMQIELPASIRELQVESAMSVKVGKQVDWPLTRDEDGNELDLGTTPPGEGKSYALKLFTKRLQPGEGWAVLRDSENSLKLEYDPTTVPYLGLWLNYGAWEGSYEAALEPASSPCDALGKAIDRQNSLSVDVGGSYSWEVRLELS